MLEVIVWIMSSTTLRLYDTRVLHNQLCPVSQTMSGAGLQLTQFTIIEQSRDKVILRKRMG